MRATWKGTISFGLVSIPVELYAAISAQSLGFKLLHAQCNAPVNYQRYCSKCNNVIEWSEVTKGLKLTDGTYFIATPANIKKLRPGKTDAIEIVEFVDEFAIDPLYFNAHYYVLPSKLNDKAYFLFTEALQKKKKTAVGRFVLRDKEHICAIQPYKGGLLLTTLNYAYEVRQMPKLDELKPPKISAKELALAQELMKKLYKKSFDINEFKDTFAEKLKAQIVKKAKGIAIDRGAKKAIKKREGASSLIDALQESIEAGKKPKKKRTVKRVSTSKSKRSRS